MLADALLVLQLVHELAALLLDHLERETRQERQEPDERAKVQIRDGKAYVVARGAIFVDRERHTLGRRELEPDVTRVPHGGVVDDDTVARLEIVVDAVELERANGHFRSPR